MQMSSISSLILASSSAAVLEGFLVLTGITNLAAKIIGGYNEAVAFGYPRERLISAGVHLWLSATGAVLKRRATASEN
jgi:hypothetical protein